MVATCVERHPSGVVKGSRLRAASSMYGLLHSHCMLARVARWLAGDKPDFDPLVQGFGDALEYGHRMAFVVGIFQAANRRGGGAHKLSKLALRQPRFGA